MDAIDSELLVSVEIHCLSFPALEPLTLRKKCVSVRRALNVEAANKSRQCPDMALAYRNTRLCSCFDKLELIGHQLRY